MIKTGIFGGSFNPIHYGHIALAQEILRQTDLDEIWLMVSPQNPLKQGATDLLADHLRYELAQKALEGVQGVEACNYEFHLPKPSYTWNTLQHLKKRQLGTAQPLVSLEGYSQEPQRSGISA